jgi:oligopeptide/dipeptide ABC transporter ATP-binding protein
MYAGRVAEEGPVARVFTEPRHPYTRKLLGAFPNIRADRRTLDVIPGQPPDLVDPPVGCRFAPRCSFAMPVCTEVDPPEVRLDDGVRVACHLFPPAGAAVPGVPGEAATTPTPSPITPGEEPVSGDAGAEGSTSDAPDAASDAASVAASDAASDAAEEVA